MVAHPNFSGPTKLKRSSRCEGESYLALAQANDYFSFDLNPTHITHDPYAFDSYQNVLFSMLTFRRYTSNYPSHVTIISHAFKRRRFLELHLPATRWPAENATYIGIDPPEDVTPKRELEDEERLKGYGAWERALYVGGEVRWGRGWRQEMVEDVLRGLPDSEETEEVKELLKWRGGEDGNKNFPGRLPWSRGTVS
ncbi:MAG: hypothetical protein Q9179_003012 [Wetmoreana sp. 5 TL-2023]